MKFIAIGPNCWGEGLTVKAAIRRASKNLPSCQRDREKKGEHFYQVFDCGDTTHVTDMGGLRWQKVDPVPVPQGKFNNRGKS